MMSKQYVDSDKIIICETCAGSGTRIIQGELYD